MLKPLVFARAAAAMAGAGALGWWSYTLYAPLRRPPASELAPRAQVRSGSPVRRSLPPRGGSTGNDRAQTPRVTPRAVPPMAQGGRPPAQRRLRRPATPLTAPLPAVNSILVGPDRRFAVLDGDIVEEGDRVGDRVLLRIEPDAVVLREPSGYDVRVPIRHTPAREWETRARSL